MIVLMSSPPPPPPLPPLPPRHHSRSLLVVQNLFLLLRGRSGISVGVGGFCDSGLASLPSPPSPPSPPPQTPTTTGRLAAAESHLVVLVHHRLHNDDDIRLPPPRSRRGGAGRRLLLHASPRGVTTVAAFNPNAPPDEERDDERDDDRSNYDGEEKDVDHDQDDPFALLSSLAATALLQLDRRPDPAGGKEGEWGQGSSATNWIDEGSAFALRNGLDKVQLYLPGGGGGDDDYDYDAMGGRGRTAEGRDEAITWLRWMRLVPSPVIVDLSSKARHAADGTVSDNFLRLLGGRGGGRNVVVTDDNGGRRMSCVRDVFMERMRCRLILLPSGRGLRGGGGLFKVAGSLTFARLL
ncbi:hypothetical protein ACHAW5_009605 [Stephanodiscus triporus]|uniref:Uncharacterized protein n=1 Tax=Stephanodiscus triporus TaxID=2934178 RepID=A0ABD3PRD9_9STRA